ncbi:hypothetical protein KFK09_004833 [Dendrobium nobile]|uniref:Transcription repressor n=1 Tax=Dendrobium nobile TaxID=94219 RepID=A0A8T3BU18_DENNO|nr:hypothetical protein KFK09_004833 [Dendrobium nobile]
MDRIRRHTRRHSEGGVSFACGLFQDSLGCLDDLSPPGESAGAGKLPDDNSPRFTEPSPDVIRAATGRFFASPAATGSLLDEACITAIARSSAAPWPSIAGTRGIPVYKVSVDPYGEFRDSMLEMVAAWKRRHADAGDERLMDWDFLKELLLCYLELNEGSVHKYILMAFFDLIEKKMDF